MQAHRHESVMLSIPSAPKATPKTAYATRPENVCVARKKDAHPLNLCGKVQGMSRDEGGQ